MVSHTAFIILFSLFVRIELVLIYLFQDYQRILEPIIQDEIDFME